MKPNANQHIANDHGQGDDREQLDQQRHDVQLEAGATAAEKQRCGDGADKYSQKVAHHGEKQRKSKVPTALCFRMGGGNNLIGENGSRSKHSGTAAHHRNTHGHFPRLERNQEYEISHEGSDEENDRQTHEEVLRLTETMKAHGPVMEGRFYRARVQFDAGDDKDHEDAEVGKRGLRHHDA